ncbi:DUF3558 family protein [Nocardia sp. NPDC050799]|uniref:DUF3558 family protein n=1 Tax=Nocardia sp. NPDC050799 TaxID=3154842 RepID=UPI0033F90E68
MRIISTVCPVALAVIISAGCATSGNSDTPTAAPPKPAGPPVIAISVPPAKTLSGDGQPFAGPDPCLELGDDVIERLGFDPLSRARNEETPSAHVFVGCSFEGRELASPPSPSQSSVVTGFLYVSASSMTLGEIRDGIKNASDTEVGGLEAVEYVYGDDKICDVVIERPYGTLSVRRSVVRSSSRQEACAGIDEIAEEVSYRLPE